MNKLSVVATPEEGQHIKNHLRKFDRLHVDKKTFGRLTFKIDAEQMTVEDAIQLCESLEFLNNDISMFIDCDNTINFDYYISSYLLPIIRGIVDEYCTSARRGILTDWHYTK